MKKSILVMFAFSIISGIAPVLEAATLIVEGGSLMGAQDVNVQGTLYDVMFLDGILCCATLGDILFPSVEASDAASQALFDQVFIDGPEGDFDSSPGLTNGCLFFSNQCTANTPYEILALPFESGLSLLTSGAMNNCDAGNPLCPSDTVVSVTWGLSSDLSFSPTHTWAVWESPPPPPLTTPLPQSSLFFGSGLIGLLFLYRRKHREQHGVM